MKQLFIRGGRPLHGEVTVQGAKNSVLPLLAAALLTKGTSVLENCPRLRDVEVSIRILRALGCTARWTGENTLLVDTAQMNRCAISDDLMREMRSSAIFLGAILARCGQAEVSYPGGWDASRSLLGHVAVQRTVVQRHAGFQHGEGLLVSVPHL